MLEQICRVARRKWIGGCGGKLAEAEREEKQRERKRKRGEERIYDKEALSSPVS